MNPDEVRKEMMYNLLEWGVQIEGPDVGHEKFAQNSLRLAVDFITMDCGLPVNKVTSNCMILSSSLIESISYVLRTELTSDGEKILCFTDATSLDYGVDFFNCRPYRVVIDKNGERSVILRREYRGIQASDLDPLSRFSPGRPVTNAEFFYRQWFEGDKNSLLGTVFEAIVSSHATNKISCYSCKSRGCLRWNGGSASSWTDMSCVNCGSDYEIKSKNNAEKINLGFKRNSFRGGSYPYYYRNRRERVKSGFSSSKHFLVAVSRTALQTRQSRSYPVYIAEIHNVLPRLKESNFCVPLDEVRPASEIRLKLRTKELWFRIPEMKQNFTFLARKVFESVYPDYFPEDVACPKDTNTTDCSKIVGTRYDNSCINKMKARFEKLAVKDDELENL